jgi:NAD-dependent protein deacetylase/lipoamidase
MTRPAVGDQLAPALDGVVETEARSPDVYAASVDPQGIVEADRGEVADVRLDRQRLEALVANRLVAAGEPGEVVDARDLEPNEVGGVVGDSLGVGLGEAHDDVSGEVESLHGRTIACMGAKRLAELIRERQPCVVLTGAGISTESGIPDFRSPTGIWVRYDPMEYATIDAFRRDPVKVWDFYAKRLQVLRDAEPNAAHLALAELESRGLVAYVITQNIDRLHELAGTRLLIEVHGSIRTSSCLRCGERVGFEEVVRLVEASGAPPCPACGAILKPDVVMFGELMPEAEIERAFELAREAALLLVIGSSLEVWPVAGLPQETLDSGGAVAVVNRDPTPYDDRAALKVGGAAAEVLRAVVETLGSAV